MRERNTGLFCFACRARLQCDKVMYVCECNRGSGGKLCDLVVSSFSFMVSVFKNPISIRDKMFELVRIIKVLSKLKLVQISRRVNADFFFTLFPPERKHGAAAMTEQEYQPIKATPASDQSRSRSSSLSPNATSGDRAPRSHIIVVVRMPASMYQTVAPIKATRRWIRRPAERCS